MNINKQKLQVQIDEGYMHAVGFAETVKLQSGLTDWAQASASLLV